MEDTSVQLAREPKSEAFSREERILFCRAVANMITADHQVSEEERAYLSGLVRETGLSLLDEEVMLSIESELRSPTPLADLVHPIKSPELRRTLYRAVVEVALCDRTLAQEEDEYLAKLAELFELNPQAARELIQWTLDSLELEKREADILARL